MVIHRAAACLLLLSLSLARADMLGPTLARAELDAALLRRAGVQAERIQCNSENRFGSTIRGDAKEGADEIFSLIAPHLGSIPQAERDKLRRQVQGVLMWRMVRAVLIEGNNNNLGVLPLKGRTFLDGSGQRRQVIIFRSGLTPDPGAPGSCFLSLLSAGGVRHVVNLFDGDIPASDLVAKEGEAARKAGASYVTASDGPAGYGPWREILRSHYDDVEKRDGAMRSVARLIREQILLPGGGPPRGNIHIHCGGGMHRSGMIAGIIERCVNGERLEVVERHYRYHVGYRDAAHPGGLEEGNLRVIRDFDCALLKAE